MRVLAASIATTVTLLAQIEPATTESGVYTPAQAARGRAVYLETCAQCHGAALTGGVGRRLAGESFVADWATLPLDRLVARARTMPPDDSPRLADEDYLAVVSYILEANAFPAGERPLTAEAAKGIVIAARSEPPDAGLVQVVGCLTRGGDGAWMATSASAPRRTKEPAASGLEERQRLANLPPGNLSFRLLNAFPSPDRFEGHRVEVKGLLISGGPERPAPPVINVTAVEAVAVDCM
jgi:mono/diheme cytochrome c family protein